MGEAAELELPAIFVVGIQLSLALSFENDSRTSLAPFLYTPRSIPMIMVSRGNPIRKNLTQ